MSSFNYEIASVLPLDRLITTPEQPLDLHKLSKTEAAVCYAFVQGSSVQDIAKAKHNSTHTIRNHLKAVFKKLDVKNSKELVIRYWRDTPEPCDGSALEQVG